jgi:putative redox protein
MLVDVKFEGGKKINAIAKGFTVKTDQDINSGGEGTAPDPFTVFLTSLAACAGFYAKTFCDQRELPTEEVQVKMETKYDPELKLHNNILISIHVPKDFPEKYENALIHAVSLCPVKRHLTEQVNVQIIVSR